MVKLKAFSKFENTAEALSAATLLIDSKPSKGLRKFLRAHCDGETLAVADSKLGNAIKEKLVCCNPDLYKPFSGCSFLNSLRYMYIYFYFCYKFDVLLCCSKLNVFTTILLWS